MYRKERRQFLLSYTLLFLIAAVLIYGYFFVNGKSLIEDGDAINQHIRALMYYGDWLKEIGSAIIHEGKLIIPQWDFSVGYGSSVIPTFHYYAIGDPLALAAGIVPKRLIPELYLVLLIMRNYLAGLAFSWFCWYTTGVEKKGEMDRTGILAGTMTYVFCGYAVQGGLRHPFFLNPMITFPLILVGVEKILKDKKPGVFIAAVFYSAISNFYFFYMAVMLTVVYVLIRCIFIFGKEKWLEAVKQIGYIGVMAAVGLLTAMMIFLPVTGALLRDSRQAVKAAVPLFYSAQYYGRLPAAFAGCITPGYWTLLAYNVTTLAAVILLFLQIGSDRKGGEGSRKRKQLRIFFVIGLLILLFPYAGYVLNGMAYVVNRWVWGYSMLCAYILVVQWKELFSADRKKLRIIGIFLFLYLLMNLLLSFYAVRIKGNGDVKRSIWYSCAALILYLALLLIFFIRKRKKPELLCVLTLAATVTCALGFLSPLGLGMVKDYIDLSSLPARIYDSPDQAVLQLEEAEADFFRYGGSGIVKNTSPEYGTHNGQFYWSMSNGAIGDFMKKLGVNVRRTYQYSDLDDRTMLSALAGYRYYTEDPEKQTCLPYGYRYLKDVDGYQIYENDIAMPFGYCYSSYITEEQLEELPLADREEALMQSAVLQKDAEKVENGKEQLKYHVSDLSYTIECDPEVKKEGDTYLVSEKNTGITLHFTGNENGETWLGLQQFAYEGSADEFDVKITALSEGSELQKKTLHYADSSSRWPTDLSDLIINMGYQETAFDEIRITFRAKGRYELKDPYIRFQSMEGYEEYITALTEETPENLKIETNRVTADISISESRILCFSIPYDRGWSAVVDGKTQAVLKTDYMFCGLELEPGEHQVILTYRTPYLREGVILSIIGLGFIIGIYFYSRRKDLKK